MWIKKKKWLVIKEQEAGQQQQITVTDAGLLLFMSFLWFYYCVFIAL